ncbi:unnamed protein product, partial [Mesorhabditis spiculigera]
MGHRLARLLRGCPRGVWKEEGARQGLLHLIIYRNVPVAITRSPEQTSTTQTYVRAFPEDPDDDPDPESPSPLPKYVFDPDREPPPGELPDWDVAPHYARARWARLEKEKAQALAKKKAEEKKQEPKKDEEKKEVIAACPMCHRPFDVDQSMKEEQKRDGEQKEGEKKGEMKKEDKKQPVNMVAANQKKESDNQSKTRYVRRKKEKKEEKEENENYV